MIEGEHTLAVFIDFENIALGFKGKKDKRFDIQKALERLVEKGKIIVKKAYADWADYAEYKKPLHEAAIELIEIPKLQRTSAFVWIPSISVIPRNTLILLSSSRETATSLPSSPN
jgi:hypothetical protein